MLVAVLIGILLVLLFIVYIINYWLYNIAKNLKIGFEEVFKLLNNQKS